MTKCGRQLIDVNKVLSVDDDVTFQVTILLFRGRHKHWEEKSKKSEKVKISGFSKKRVNAGKKCPI